MISPEDQAILDDLDFEPHAEHLSAKQRLVRGLGAVAAMGVTAIGLKYLPPNAYDQVDPRAFLDFTPAVIGLFLGYEALSGHAFFGHEPQPETEI